MLGGIINLECKVSAGTEDLLTYNYHLPGLSTRDITFLDNSKGIVQETSSNYYDQ